MDIDLTEKGRNQATQAGKLLALHGFEFDEAHASLLKRAVRTLWTALHSSNHHWIPVKHSWRLNERHYGALTGISKQDAAIQLGEEMLLKYRRGYDTEPLPMTSAHPCWTGDDRRYKNLGPLLPTGESLKMAKARILPYWFENIVPSIRARRRVLVAAHNNVIRCLCKHIDGIHRDHLRDFEIPTGTPLVYNLDAATLEPLGKRNHIGFSGTFLTAKSSVELTQNETQGTSLSTAFSKDGKFWAENHEDNTSGDTHISAQSPLKGDGITQHARIENLLLENSVALLEQVGTTSKLDKIDVRHLFSKTQLLREAERLGIDAGRVSVIRDMKR